MSCEVGVMSYGLCVMGYDCSCESRAALIPDVIDQGHTVINGSLRHGGRNGEFRKEMIIKEQGVQFFAQGIIRHEFQGHNIFSGGNLIVVYFQVPDYGNIVP